MSAQTKIEEKPTLGVIAGGGALPLKLLEACDRKGIIPFVVGFEGQTNPETVRGRYHLWTPLGAAGQIIQTLKAHGIKEIVLIGSVRRPSLDELRPDWKTARLLTRIGFSALGDDGLLKGLHKELTRQGFTIRGVQDFIDDLLASHGNYASRKPDRKDWPDIEKGCSVVKRLGHLDIGQACIVQRGLVLGVEAVEGTDRLIQRCGELKRDGAGGILVKLSKPGQEKNLDLPTIGPETISQIQKAGLHGVVIEAGRTILVDPQETAYLADKAGIFLSCLDLDDDGQILNKPD